MLSPIGPQVSRLLGGLLFWRKGVWYIRSFGVGRMVWGAIPPKSSIKSTTDPLGCVKSFFVSRNFFLMGEDFSLDRGRRGLGRRRAKGEGEEAGGEKEVVGRQKRC